MIGERGEQASLCSPPVERENRKRYKGNDLAADRFDSLIMSGRS
jgi:hypothetical protein